MCGRIDKDIYELRKGRHRILFAQEGNSFILLSGFFKKTRKTPPEEKKLAKERLSIFLLQKKQRAQLLQINSN